MNTVWRSFLRSRSVPLLSRLRPAVRHHGCGGSVALLRHGINRSTDHITRRGYYANGDGWSDWTDCDDDYYDKCPADDAGGTTPGNIHVCGSCGHQRRRRRHLYVVLDDWSKGFSIHKLDLTDRATMDANGGLGARPPANGNNRLPPPAARIEFSNAGAGARFAALGSNIVACTQGKDGLTVVYDTITMGQAIVRRSPDVLHYTWQAAVAAGGRLYAFVSNSDYCVPPMDRVPRHSSTDSGNVQLSTGEMYNLKEEMEYSEGVFGFGHGRKKWSWSADPSPLPFDLDENGMVSSYAVHPGGNTIFVSVTPAVHDNGYGSYGDGYDTEDEEAQAKKANEAKAKAGTYSYNIKIGEWRHLGNWMLPFGGQAYYDDELDGWVGLDTGSNSGATWVHGPSKIGCCDVIGSPPGPAAPSWKKCENISSVSESGWRMGTVLIGMGHGRFCLVESVLREGIELGDSWGDGEKWELRVTTFRLRYNRNGDLKIMERRLAHSYVLSRYARHNDPFSVQAFWM